MLTIELLWTQAALFPRQLWQWLKQLGRKLLAIVVACLLPFALFFDALPGRSKASATIELTFPNLLYVSLPEGNYKELPTEQQSDRRGPISENREDIDRPSALLIPALNPSTSVLLPASVVRSNLAPSVFNSYHPWLSDRWTINDGQISNQISDQSWPFNYWLPNPANLSHPPFPILHSPFPSA